VIKEGKGEKEIRFRHFVTGLPIWMNYHLTVLYNRTGEPIGLATISRDITAQKDFSEELKKQVFERTGELELSRAEAEHSKERLAAVFNNAQAGMFTFAPVWNEQGLLVDFRFVITNPAFAAYVGQTPEVLNGALGSTWFPGYLTNGVFDMYKQTFLTGETLRKDVHYHVDQHDLYLDLMSSKMGNEVLVSFNDYTPLKQAQLQLQKTIEDLRRSNANLEEFAYAASHDLKEPIRKIHFFSDRLKISLSDRLNEDEKIIFQKMETASRRMSSLIDDLLSYSQVGLRPRMLEEVNMSQMIRQVLDDLELEIEEKKAQVKLGKLFNIQGHHRQLQQAFQNLIGNALKYNKPGTPPDISIGCSKVKGNKLTIPLSQEERERDYYCISIGDNGIGFDQKDAERIFNVFTRLHGNTAAYRGTGIGLSIVRKVMENHDGFVSAESKPGQGSIFKLYFPQ
ncbi:MAG TPA: ATP-binding protein, partial [Flavisolibacter sp.]|nr:ATP-binding protein [Flavisolibacter sp.]